MFFNCNIFCGFFKIKIITVYKKLIVNILNLYFAKKNNRYTLSAQIFLHNK